MDQKQIRSMAPSLFTAENALEHARSDFSPFLYFTSIDKKKEKGVLGLLIIDNKKRGFRKVDGVASISWSVHPAKVAVAKGSTPEARRLFLEMKRAPRCPSCHSRLLTKSEFTWLIGATGIEAFAGSMDYNKYCPLDWDRHPFWCSFHEGIHEKRCEHDYSVVDARASAPCPKCGDPLFNAAEMVREIRRGW